MISASTQPHLATISDEVNSNKAESISSPICLICYTTLKERINEGEKLFYGHIHIPSPTPSLSLARLDPENFHFVCSPCNTEMPSKVESLSKDFLETCIMQCIKQEKDWRKEFILDFDVEQGYSIILEKPDRKQRRNSFSQNQKITALFLLTAALHLSFSACLTKLISFFAEKDLTDLSIQGFLIHGVLVPSLHTSISLFQGNELFGIKKNKELGLIFVIISVSTLGVSLLAQIQNNKKHLPFSEL